MSLIYKLSKIPLILKQAPVSHLLSIGLLIQWSGVGFRVSKGQDVPGQTGAGGPVVPLSRDKKVSLSRCPFVPGQGQEQMSQDKLLCPGTSQNKMNFKISKKMTRFPVSEHHFPALEHPFLF